MTQIITIAGEPVVFFEFEPNWSVPVTTTHAYRTDIFTAYAGNEQRRALRQTPRQSYDYRVSLSRADKRAFDAVLSARLGYLFAVAEPTRGTQAIGLAVAGTSRVSVEDEPDWVTPGAYLALVYKSVREVRQVASREGYEIVFTENSAHAWPAGTKVRPVKIGRFDAKLSQKNLTSEVLEAAMSFMVEPAVYDFRVRGYPRMMFDDLEVLDRRPNWSAPLDIDIMAELSILDFERGARLVENPVPYNTRVYKATYLSRDREEADQVEALFHRARGRRGRFYAPSWTRDFDVDVDVTAGESFLVVSSLDAFRFLSADLTHKRIALVAKDGQVYPNLITGMVSPTGGWGNIYGLDYGGTGAPGFTVIGVRDPWPVDLPREEIASASWLFCSRFASDSLTLTWQTDQVATFQLNLQTVEDIPGEPTGLGGWGLAYGLDYGGTA